MRSTLAHVTLVSSTLIVAFGAIGASACIAQTRVTSLEELRRQLATDDFITVVPAGGQPVAGRLTRLGSTDLAVRLVNKRTQQERGQRDVTIALNAIQSLERPRDSARNGAAIGAGIGAGSAVPCSSMSSSSTATRWTSGRHSMLEPARSAVELAR